MGPRQAVDRREAAVGDRCAAGGVRAGLRHDPRWPLLRRDGLWHRFRDRHGDARRIHAGPPEEPAQYLAGHVVHGRMREPAARVAVPFVAGRRFDLALLGRSYRRVWRRDPRAAMCVSRREPDLARAQGAARRCGARDDPHLRAGIRSRPRSRAHAGRQSGHARCREPAADLPRRLSAAHDPGRDRADRAVDRVLRDRLVSAADQRRIVRQGLRLCDARRARVQPVRDGRWFLVAGSRPAGRTAPRVGFRFRGGLRDAHRARVVPCTHASVAVGRRAIAVHPVSFGRTRRERQEPVVAVVSR